MKYILSLILLITIVACQKNYNYKVNRDVHFYEVKLNGQYFNEL